ncbi:MAG: SH3 domain-containing protein [Aeromonas sp.]|uniref:SH3 domain-containing protein n=1 Tax=Aeromonas sp. TaxID=647 RepID=UPI002FC69DFB
MENNAWLVISSHRSEYPEPITFAKGTPLMVGERYEGEEDWQDWLFCQCAGQQGGWVPAQLIEWLDKGQARAREDYTARELNVQPDDQLVGHRMINGWIWCDNVEGTASGWVPLANLRELREP